VGDRALVAVDMGPLGELLEPMGTLTFEDAYDVFSEIVKAAVLCDKAGSGADLGKDVFIWKMIGSFCASNCKQVCVK